MNDAGELGKIVNASTGEVLAQIFGPPRAAGRDDLGGYLYDLSELLARGYAMPGMHGGLGGQFSWGVNFENDVFLMVPYNYDAECNCGFCERADEWHKKHRHKGSCYSVMIGRLERKWETANGRPICMDKLARFSLIARRICELRGIPWNGGYGSGCHCDCGLDQEAETWFAANDHEFRCPCHVPNFWHKRTGIEIRWYKSIGRDMTIKPEDATADIIGEAICEAFESIPEEIRNKAQRDYDVEHTSEAEETKAEFYSLMFKALQQQNDSMTPCWGCSEVGQLMPMKASGNMRGGMFSGGIGRTLHDESGACLNCGHLNTPRQTARLAQQEELNKQVMRARWASKP